jgi:mono/diheme cytochrome c family protein
MQAGVVAVSAGICMAAGWWIVHHNHQQAAAAPAVALVAKVEPVKPVKAPAVVAEPKPVEKPAPPPAKPQAAPKPVEKLPVVIAPTPAPPPPPAKSASTPATTNLTFQKDIAPILQAKCVLCHGDRNKFKGGLDARTLRSLEKGGDSGPAINRQDPETSPLWDSVASGQMPPGKNKLTEAEKKKLHDWLVGGGK